MILKSIEDIRAGRYESPEESTGNVYGVSPAIGTTGGQNDGKPHAFMIEMAEGCNAGPHFHKIDQFQFFIHGSCKLGRWQMKAFSAHWADPFTTYGPIIPGADSVAFLTLRIDGNDFQHYMPQSRSEKVRRSGRNVIALAGDEPIFSEPVAPGATRTEATLGPLDDGLAAYVVKAGSGGTIESPDMNGGKGQYMVVLTGSVEWRGEVYQPGSLGLRLPGDPSFSVEASADGATVWFGQFPRPDNGSQN